MFPLKANDPYIKATGERSTLGSVVGGGGSDTPELPDYGIADAGKVLTVGDDGTLEWDTSGAGGGDEVILDYFESFAQGSGAHTYTREITSTDGGIYVILVGGFCSSATIQKNNVTIPNSFDDFTNYAHYYHAAALELAANDVITITMESNGKTVFFASIVKKAPEV